MIDGLAEYMRALFGDSVVTAGEIEAQQLPTLAAPGISVIGEQWIVIETGRLLSRRRWELDYSEAGVAEARQISEAASRR